MGRRDAGYQYSGLSSGAGSAKPPKRSAERLLDGFAKVFSTKLSQTVPLSLFYAIMGFDRKIVAQHAATAEMGTLVASRRNPATTPLASNVSISA
jgi:hypothetical protein